MMKYPRIGDLQKSRLKKEMKSKENATAKISTKEKNKYPLLENIKKDYLK